MITRSTLSNAWERGLTAYRRGRLSPAVAARIRPYVQGLKYALYSPASNRVATHCPDYVEPKPEERALVERIFAAYQRMKRNQARAPRCCLPSSMWQGILDEAYAPLNQGDVAGFHFFLANFGAWKADLGIESTALIRNYAGSFLKRRYLQNVVFHKQLNFWHWFYNHTKPASALSYPTFGNQAGAYVDGTFMGVGSFFNEIYGSLLSGLLEGIKRPVVAELGGGYGKLAHFTLRSREAFTYVDFDLPETLCLAMYWLMQAYPGKRVLLYGEGEYSPECHQRYDLIFMPSWEIGKLDASTVDLFMNKNSLGEMTKEAVEHYVACIAKAARYFFHMNHERTRSVFGNGESGMLGYEYPVPADRFTLLFRYPDIGHLLYQGGLDLSVDIFLYLYERKDVRSQP